MSEDYERFQSLMKQVQAGSEDAVRELLEDWPESKRSYPSKVFNPLGEVWKPFRCAPQQTNLMVRG